MKFNNLHEFTGTVTGPIVEMGENLVHFGFKTKEGKELTIHLKEESTISQLKKAVIDFTEKTIQPKLSLFATVHSVQGLSTTQYHLNVKEVSKA